MSQGSIARRYARALMAIGIDNKNYELIGREVQTLATAMKVSRELAETLSNPAFPRADRQKVLGAIMDRLGAAPVVKSFTLLLLDRERIGILPDIARELSALIDERSGRVAAKVTSAAPLSPAQVAQLKLSLERLSGKEVHIEHKQDPELLGGVIAKLGDIIYDGSLRTQLSQMRQSLAK